MNRSSATPGLLPPRLSMDEYADFVEASLRECDAARVARQKALEKQIRVPFRMPSEPSPPTKLRLAGLSR